MYNGARFNDDDQLKNLMTMLASLKTRVVEHKKSSCIVFDCTEPIVVQRGTPAFKPHNQELITEKDPFDNPKSWK